MNALFSENEQFLVYNMDVLKALAKLPSNSVDCVVTSPPYWGLRDYKVEGQIGLEEHPQQWIDKMVAVFEEIKRVLKPTGTVFLNVGDTYYGGGGGNQWSEQNNGIYAQQLKDNPEYSDATKFSYDYRRKNKSNWLQPKQRMLIPHRLAIALQDKGWILRNDLVWHKLNHMPSSVRDRFSNSFEYVFFFVKQRKYFFDLDAVRVPHKEVSIERAKHSWNDVRPEGSSWQGLDMAKSCHPSGKNPSDYFEDELNDVFETTLEPFSEAHFACFPTALPRHFLKCGCPKQVCKKCGKPRTKIFKKIGEHFAGHGNNASPKNEKLQEEIAISKTSSLLTRKIADYETVGFSDCGCNAGWESGVVLDPFVGSGTTLQVAQEMGLRGIGIELNPKYLPLINLRLLGDKNQTSLNEKKIEVIKE